MIPAVEEYRPDMIIVGMNHFQDAVWMPHAFDCPVIGLALSNAVCVDPNKAPFGLASLPFSWNVPIWKLVFGTYIKDVKSAMGDDLIMKLTRNEPHLFTTGDDFIDVFGRPEITGLPGRYAHIPLLCAMDDSVLGRQPIDPDSLKYVGPIVLSPKQVSQK